MIYHHINNKHEHMMEFNYFIDSWNRITIHQIVHLLNNIIVCQRICKYISVLNDSAVNKLKLHHSSDNIHLLKAETHEQHMEGNADGLCCLILLTLLYAHIRDTYLQMMGCKVLKTLNFTIYV